MVYGELVINPIVSQVKARLLCQVIRPIYWTQKICKFLYNSDLSLLKDNIYTFPWISFVKQANFEKMTSPTLKHNFSMVKTFTATLKT